MDWADDVAYSVHDVEDGVHAGQVRLGADRRPGPRAAVRARRRRSTPPGRRPSWHPVLDRLLQLPTLRDLADYDGSYAAQAAAKRATSELTGRLAGAAVAATRQRHGTAPFSRYAADLICPPRWRTSAPAQGGRGAFRHAPTGHGGAAGRRAPAAHGAGLGPRRRCPGHAGPRAGPGVAAGRARRRAAARGVDQVAQLTDTSALAWHRRWVRPR